MTGPTLLTISPGPKQLRLMPEAEQAGLDPYIAQIIGNRKSGLSLNHIVGCALNCGYCVRHFWGNFDMKIPQLLVPTDQAIDLLIGHPMFTPHVTPLQIFNKATDPFLPGVKPHLFQVLAALDQRGFTNHMLVITRFKVTADDMAFLESLQHLRVTLLFTYSGITDDRIEPISKSNMTVTSIRTAAEHRKRTGVILYWRPITPGWNDSPETMAHVLEVGRDVDAMVFTGLYHKQENATYLESLGVTVPYSEDEYHRRKTMAADLDARVVAAWRASGSTTPLFRKTSCGVAYAHATFDYNGHWGVRELCDICPLEQQRRCADALQQPTDDQMRAALDHFGFDTPWEFDDGHVWTTGLGEQRRYALQHRFGYQFWDIETPHVLGAHGRSLTGHDLDPAQAADFERVRQNFALAARTEDD
ncbi:hypothetical protein [Actinoplanes sp. HUAS TT8]|uniref:hypothetical protein n=1 Tax=Actinoplanes sp. HUAS TT8 TaxID=3447453 RepID=UPI003F51CDDD